MAINLRNPCRGLTKIPGWKSWYAMHRRCYNVLDASYERYGGRGIKVCERWHDPNLFFSDMGPRPPELTLERINGDKDYEPGNCKWATRKEQQRNRKGVLFTYEIATQIRETYESAAGSKASRVKRLAVEYRCATSRIYAIINNEQWVAPR